MPNPQARQRRRAESVKGWLAIYLIPLIALCIAAWAVHTAAGKAGRNELSAVRAEKAERISKDNRRILNTIQGSRRRAVNDSCQADAVLASVMRTILLSSLANVRDPAQRAAFARRLDEQMRPVGGLRPLTKAQVAHACAVRVERGVQP